MAGQQAVVAATIRDRFASLAEDYHCAMHALNLCCSRAVNATAIRHAQDIVTQATSFFGGSAKRTDHFVSTVQAHAPAGTKSRLVTLCTTRFVERHSAVIAFWSLLPYIEMALTSMNSRQSKKSGAQPSSVAAQASSVAEQHTENRFSCGTDLSARSFCITATCLTYFTGSWH